MLISLIIPPAWRATMVAPRISSPLSEREISQNLFLTVQNGAVHFLELAHGASTSMPRSRATLPGTIEAGTQRKPEQSIGARCAMGAF
jgi:hypothetical protein